MMPVDAALGQSFSPVLTAGVNATQIDGDKQAGYNKAGIHAGVGVRYVLKSPVKLQGEIAYSQKGARNSADDPFILIQRVNYLSMTTIVGYEGISKGVWLEGGLAADVLLGQYYEFNGFVTRSFEGRLRRVDLPVVVGVEVPINPKFSGNIRLYYSIRSIAERLGLFNNQLAITIKYMPTSGRNRNK
jgi:hypothetical protein